MHRFCFLLTGFICCWVAYANDSRVLSQKTPFTISVRKSKITPGFKKNEKPRSPFEKITLAVYKSGAPLTPRWLNGAQVTQDSSSRVLEGCLTQGESNYELKNLTFEKQPIGWIIRRGESCGTVQRYRYRVIALQAIYQNTYEIEFSSRTPVTIQETGEGLDFWTLKQIVNKQNSPVAPLEVPEVHRLKIQWGKLFEFFKTSVPNDPVAWPEIPGFERNFQSYFFTGLKNLNYHLMEFAAQKYFNSKDKSLYKSWGLPESVQEANTLIDVTKKIDAFTSLSELNNFKL